MKVWTNLSHQQINQVLLEELSKAQAELKIAKNDIDKATRRISFCLTAINEINNRYEEAK